MNNFQHIMFKKHWELSPETLSRLGQCETMVEVLSNTPIRPNRHQEFLSLSLVKGAQATTAIEGNTLSLEEVERIQKGGSLPPSKEYMETEVRNIIGAFNQLLRDVAVDGTVRYITPDLLKEFHMLIGADLGESFDAIPGKFREDSRVVGGYRCPPHKDVVPYIINLCEWLRREFNFGKNNSFINSVIQAIVTHVYIEWIHPFGDGNGRTGRLVEFYILLRAGLPSIATHILSNFYNDTRPMYYRHLDHARLSKDLTAFIDYAVLGFRDGLKEMLDAIQESQFNTHWRYYIYEEFAEVQYNKKDVFKRKRNLMLKLDTKKVYSFEDIFEVDTSVLKDYLPLSEATKKRDVKELIEMKLLVKVKKKYKANTAILKAMTPVRKGHPNNVAGV